MSLLPSANEMKRKQLLETQRLLKRYTNYRFVFLWHYFKIHYLPVCILPLYVIAGLGILSYCGIFHNVPSTWHLVLFFALLLLVWCFWIYLLNSDPGVIINEMGETSDLQSQYSSLMSTNTVNDTSVCSFCCIEKPYRCEHCLQCGNCILLKDNHYNWIHNCIGMHK